MSKTMTQGLKTALDLGPLVVFFGAFYLFGIMIATGAFMAATLASLAVTYAIERRLAPMPLVTGIIVTVFGGLTLYLQDETFIKLKPTIVYSLFALALLGGLAFGQVYVKHLFSGVFQLTDDGWRQLTWRFGVFFLLCAVLNEIIWRSVSTEAWVAFKVWGFTSLSMAFSVWQVLAVSRHTIKAGPQTD